MTCSMLYSNTMDEHSGGKPRGGAGRDWAMALVQYA